MAARAAAIQKEIDDDYGTVFAKTKVELDGVKEHGNRTDETNLGDLIMRRAGLGREARTAPRWTRLSPTAAASGPPSRRAILPRRTSTPCCPSATP
ncbi:MAG: hypothetical protein ACLSHO_07860 [Dysosmobacter sp.]